jgi:hypothetical protein
MTISFAGWAKLSFLSKLRLSLGVLLLGLILFFAYLKIVPGGHMIYQRDWPAGLKSGKGFIYDFKPAERLIDDGQSLRIVADPVYFSLAAPRRFDRAKVTIRYYDHLGSTTPIIELGVLQDKVSGTYDLKPLANGILDNWRRRWPCLEDDNQRLILQADEYYATAADFDRDLAAGQLHGCPSGPASCVAVYDYPLTLDYRLPDAASSSPLVISQPLRGRHQFYVYFPAGSWHLDLAFTDLNQDKAADPITVKVYDGDRIVAARSITDLNSDPTGDQAENKSLILDGTAAHAGAYKVVVNISDDVIIASIRSSSDRLAFINNIWPVSGSGSLTLFTDASYLQAQTTNPANLSEIDFGGRTFSLTAPYRQFTFAGGAGVKAIKLAKDDIVLSGNGVFALSRDGLIDPAPLKMDRFFAPGDSVRYIIASYQPPADDNGLKTASADFDLTTADRTDGQYTFLISVPGLEGIATTAGTATTTPADFLSVKEIKIELNGKTLWQRIWQ